MLKRIIAAAIAALILFPVPHSDSPYDALRLHIIANSDSEADQAAKLAVRDAVLEFERRFDPVDRGEAQEILLAHGGELLEIAENVLSEHGIDYGANLYMGRYEFPEREYGDTVYPAGEYEALRIVLGDGCGKNWWCVMFPPLCILEISDAEAAGSDSFRIGKYRFSSLALKLLKKIDGGKLWKRITSN